MTVYQQGFHNKNDAFIELYPPSRLTQPNKSEMVVMQKAQKRVIRKKYSLREERKEPGWHLHHTQVSLLPVTDLERPTLSTASHVGHIGLSGLPRLAMH